MVQPLGVRESLNESLPPLLRAEGLGVTIGRDGFASLRSLTEPTAYLIPAVRLQTTQNPPIGQQASRFDATQGASCFNNMLALTVDS